MPAQNQLIKVTIKNRQKVVYSGSATYVTSTNEQGQFDILPFHANFITLVKDYIILDKGLQTQQKIDIDKGLLMVMSNNVEVYAGL